MSIDRRTLLRAAGVGVVLPWLPSARLLPRPRAGGSGPVRRLVCVGLPYGMYREEFVPRQVDAGYELPGLLRPLAALESRFTIFTHLDHGVSGGHAGARAFLSGIRPEHAAAVPEKNVTIDQRAGEFFGAATRYPVLNLGVGGSWEMCWSRNGVHIVPLKDPVAIFDLLFREDDAATEADRRKRLDQRTSILDAVRDRALAFRSKLGAEDGEALDGYLTAVRSLERRIQRTRTWIGRPKPEVDAEQPVGSTEIEAIPILFELMALALQTDSSRSIALELTGSRIAKSLGIRNTYHACSHHGMTDERIANLLRIEGFYVEELARFLERLQATPDPLAEGSLLDNTQVLFGSGLGDGNSHSCRDLPVILAGGGFEHGRHLDFLGPNGERTPLCNLYLGMLRHLGLDLERFGNSTGTLPGFEG